LGILTKPAKSDSQLIPTYLLLRYNIKKKKSYDNWVPEAHLRAKCVYCPRSWRLSWCL